ncbi:molybdate ABC transporter substrate-binding protein [Halobacillus yeomjeoni]|uniref:molybdate ABC transporter substrate-binding protein n=1 Tax=Halobacillus yeomjeoni TaxID=311194 RepID=UPI001CD54403|nr:molybdate ABC transporter substrate-binding protein [Halobacillus yeomjeoni]MCA0984921.1 molybdate ABC transporter substrate-binding protein [Halobacillus yeomjeoni]
MNRPTIVLYFTTLLFGLTSCSNVDDTSPLTISAASSLTDVLSEIADEYERENNESIEINFSSSGKIAQQIIRGAPVDVFLSADQRWMNKIEEQNLIVKNSRHNIVGNQLVLIVPKHNRSNVHVEDLKFKDGKVAIGDPDSVPAGTYTKQVLKKIQLWEEMHGRTVFTSNVRQVLAYVESENVHYGFIYASDAKISDRVRIAEYIDKDLHKPIVYPAAVIDNKKNQKRAEKFLTYLQSERAQQIFHKYGFQEVINTR